MSTPNVIPIVIPAKAGIHRTSRRSWIPAFAGMTVLAAFSLPVFASGPTQADCDRADAVVFESVPGAADAQAHARSPRALDALYGDAADKATLGAVSYTHLTLPTN